jgi:acylphosphatase
MKVTRSLRILGRVQGVMFRESMREQAERLGVTGWVRNRRDGSLEALVQGEVSEVEAIIAWAHHGPELALVTRVVVADASGEYCDFARLPTE